MLPLEFLQGACSKTDCPYLHVNLDPDARVCEAFLRGWCPDGAACRQKHLTPDMVRRLRRERTLRPGAQVRHSFQLITSTPQAFWMIGCVG